MAEGTPSMPVETMVRGLTLALEAVVKHLEGDVIAVGGTEH